MEGTLEELRRISNCPEGATFSQLGLRKSLDQFARQRAGVPDSPHHRGGEVERRSPPAEEAEFELARARGRVALFLRRRRGRRSIRVVSKDAGPFHGGTGGSNPLRSGSQSVSLVPSATTGTKGQAFAANVSLEETRERDVVASNR